MRLFWILGLIFFIGACASAIDGQLQEITVKTPGAEEARCTVNTGRNKYIAYTDQTITVKRSPYNMVVNCLAEGMREQTVLVKREANEWVFLNVANGFVPGAAYDYFSQAAFEYPDIITVPFGGMAYGMGERPEYDETLRKLGGDVYPEYYGPNEVRTDDTDVVVPLKRINRNAPMVYSK